MHSGRPEASVPLTERARRGTGRFIWRTAADEAAAKVAIDKAADDAAKLGWQRKAARSFVRKADAFTSIPKPAKVRK
jgi:hypothetical protein